ncbi:MAG: TonB-dependent receptor [Prevotella sp.]|jgi:TonB-linked SusC/RagA family outer membrane protein|nr:TonB-dependent receptor [Prevotella sp.]MCI1282192.1 TonB-dependent receptor [Prevotella sp.]
MGKRLTMILAGLFLSLGIAMAQTSVKGNVTSSEDGEPVVGASIKVVGTNTGTVTDVDGNFQLTVPNRDSRLEISYIGRQSKTVRASSNMKITLDADNQTLDEVMVVAFGTQKREAFTGSAAVVSSKDLSVHTTTNVANALVGSVPGLQMRGTSGAPGASQGSLHIRGISSLYAGTDPLIIVDGAPYSASLSNIPPEDIESVSVLKDASSAALYGARGASGVILITTKRGKEHQAQVNLDVKWGVNSRAVQDYNKITDPAEFYESYYAQLYNYKYYGQGASAADANTWANSTMLTHLGYNVYTVPTGEQLIGLNGKLNSNATLGRSYTYNGETYYMTPDNWTDLAYSNTLRQEYNMSVNAANDRGSFYTSLGYLKDDGIIEYSGYERISARAKADYQVKKWMKIGFNFDFVHSHTNANANMSTDWSSANLMYYTSYIAPIYPVYVRVLDANGNPTIRTDANGNPQYDYGVAATNYGINRAFLTTGNPLGNNRYNNVYSNGNHVDGSIFADFTFTDWMKLSIRSSFDYGQTSASDYENSLYGSSVSTNGALAKEQSNTMRQNHVQTLSFFKQFGEHNVNLMLGHEYYDTRTKYLGASKYGGFSPEVQELDAFATMKSISSNSSEYNVEGFFANAQYNFLEKYYASASYRRDATSRFLKKNRWGDFWSIGAAWIISKEDFMASTRSWLDELKLKASIGQQGNDNIGNFRYIDLYTLSKSSETTMSPSFAQIGNPDLTWETTTNFNVGLEFSLFKQRLTGTLDVYSKKTTDLLFWLSIPESAGTRGYYGNIGDIRNSGVELTLTGAIVRTRDIDWTVSGNISHNATKILKLPASKTTENGGFYESSYWYAEGQPMYNYMNYAYAGVNSQGEALYYYDADLSTLGGQSTNIINKPGTKYSGTTTNIGEASRYTKGSLLPKAYGGFSTSFRYKNFDATATFDYQLGGKIFDSMYQKLMTPATSTSDAGYTYSTDWAKAWTQNNTSSNIPRWQYMDSYAAYTSDRWLTSASYLNFQSFNVGYSLPQSLLRTIDLTRVRFYVSGENLCFWSARKGLDPRYSYSSTASTSVYSPVRTISGGVQVTF